MTPARPYILACVLLAAAGIAAFVLGWALLQGSASTIVEGVGIGLLVLSVAVLALASRKHEPGHAKHSHSKYACPRCHYEATKADLEKGKPVPCPTCGQYLYM